MNKVIQWLATNLGLTPRELTSDEVIADKVRGAVLAYNEALGEAQRAGLNVCAIARSRYGTSYEILFDKKLEIRYISRSSTQQY